MLNNFPVSNPTKSFWQSEPHRLANFCSSAVVPETCDIAIVGTGLAGVASAYHILSKAHSSTRPKPDVVLFEARQACSGATGRNGGHAKAGIPSIKGLLEKYGQEVGKELIACFAAQRQGLKATTENEGIDCDLFVTRSFDVLFDPEQAQTVKTWLYDQFKDGAAWTEEVQWLEGPNLERMTGVKGAVGATSVPAVSLWPYKFVTSLLDRILELGGRLYTETPVQTVIPDQNGGFLLSTPRGTTRTMKVVYATNGYTPSLLPEYKDVIVPIRGQAPQLVPDETTHHGLNLTNTYNLFYNPNSVDYLVPRPDGAIILGGASRVYRQSLSDRNPKWFNTVDDSTLIDPAISGEFDNTMSRHFRGWENSNAKVAHTWTGIMGSTPDSLPHVGRIPGTNNQWILAGFNGGGMSIIFTVAEGIADMVLDGKEFEDTSIPSVFKTNHGRMSKKFAE